MKKRHCLANTNNAGMALLTALIFISITVLVLTSMTARYVQQRLQTDRFEDQYLCFEAAEAAVGQCEKAIDEGKKSFRIGIPDNWAIDLGDTNGKVVLPDFEDSEVQPASFASLPSVEYIAYVHSWKTMGTIRTVMVL